ncbi:MarR family transcriptional regulator [Desulfosporosinus sp. PR]|uniref:MarR family winged helix-turn-helix transcriptional regulator n=1 Tax=Candidatus Desulfosporosinus nitrosoreducens TaxID=3401928 RepID=UPI0027EE6A1C|nr:MarR family transcriptional regulator [Desulfosporosinus sp. PR]MDQ7092418.1 MarR family transcriptional regulator [Desulfosporosinus sp. PR]
MAKDDRCSPSKYICYKLSRVMRKINRYYESNLSHYGLTPSQFYVLSVVWEHDGLKFKDLAKRLEMDGSTLTSILDRLERQDLAERRDDPEDRRSLLVFLKQKALENISEITYLAEKMDQEIKGRFSKEEYETFENVLDKLFQD